MCESDLCLHTSRSHCSSFFTHCWCNKDLVAVFCQVLPSSGRKFHHGGTQMSSRFFATDRGVSCETERVAVDPYCLVQKELDTIADSIRKVKVY